MKLLRILSLVGMFFYHDGAHAVEAPDVNAAPANNEMWRVRGVPIIFDTENMGFSYGAGGVALSAGQPQAALFGSVIGSSNDSVVGMLGAFNYQIPFIPNVYWSADSYRWDITEYQSYSAGEDGYAVRDMDSPFDQTPLENKARQTRIYGRYVIPIADGERASANLNLRNFIPERPQTVKGWTPWTSGVTSIRGMYELSTRDYTDSGSTTKTGADVFRLRFMWDNTDSWVIPDKGARFLAEYSWGADHYGSDDWQFWTGQASGFLNLGNVEGWTRQQVLALNLWMSDTPTWNEGNRPPDYLGSSLGGLMRLRGYDSYRFYDKSAWAYQLEYRLIPKWQPLTNLFSKISIRVPWWQFAVFADAGAVAPSFDVAEFHKELKWTAGVGMRIFIEGLVFRFDLGVSDEDSSVAVMIDQPF